MSTLTVSQLAKSYHPDDIFSGVTFSLPKKGRYAIVGPNGVGKTTLLKILAGEEKASGGEFHFAKSVNLGYLHQEAAVNKEHTLWEECLTAFEGVLRQAYALKRLEEEMSASELSEDDLETIVDAYGKIQAEFDHAGGYNYETRIQQVLSGLGFREQDYVLKMDQLSGGQRTRAVLARLLLSNHNLLLLDEPTNHLDIAAVEWLENFLREWNGAVLIVSHDRYFIDRVATHILEMSRGRMETYKGNYTTYVKKREERWRLRREFFDSEKARLEKELDYIKRNMAGQNVAQAKGKLRRLSRYLEAVENLGFDGVKGKKWGEIAEDFDYGNTMGVAEAESRIKTLTPPTNHHQTLSMRLTPRKRSGKIILRTKDLQIGYPGNVLFDTDDIEFHRLECAAIIGPNGSGKSTFLKTIQKKLDPLKGEVVLGASLDLAYFAQAHEDLNPEYSLMEEIDALHPMLPAQIRKYLARFQFRGEDVFKKVSVLSGGERGRLALAKLSLTNANLLLLDEPTNHLDIPSQEILQDVLANFGGTILLVSHDRYLIDALATQVWEIHLDRKEMTVFEGTYAEYRKPKIESVETPAAASKLETVTRKETVQRDRKAKNKAQKQARRNQKRLNEVEHLISLFESRKEKLTAQLTDPPDDHTVVQKLGEEFVEVDKVLDDLMWEWAELQQSGD